MRLVLKIGFLNAEKPQENEGDFHLSYSIKLPNVLGLYIALGHNPFMSIRENLIGQLPSRNLFYLAVSVHFLLP